MQQDLTIHIVFIGERLTSRKFPVFACKKFLNESPRKVETKNMCAALKQIEAPAKRPFIYQAKLVISESSDKGIRKFRLVPPDPVDSNCPGNLQQHSHYWSAVALRVSHSAPSKDGAIFLPVVRSL